MSTRNNPPHRDPLGGPNSPLLCYVTDCRAQGIANPADSLAAVTQKIEEAIAAGIDWVQIREKDLSARELASLMRHALDIVAKLSARRAGPLRVLVNDRLDVAIAERAGGVHLGERSLPVAAVKQLLASAVQRKAFGESFLVGVSCHSLEAAQAAQRDGADYIFFGPVFATPSKAGFGAPQGLDRLAEVCRSVSIPVLAIGGITLDNAASCMHAGAAGLAVIRLFQGALDPISTVDRLRQIVTDSRH